MRMEVGGLLHDVTLETELGLEQTVLGLAVLATIATVDALVRAHEAGSTGLHSVGEGPHVEFLL